MSSSFTFRRISKFFSEFTEQHQKNTINKIFELFTFLEGNNIYKLIEKIYNSELGKKYFFQYYFETQTKPILNNISLFKIYHFIMNPLIPIKLNKNLIYLKSKI